MNSPFARLNAATMREERRQSLARLGALATLIIVAAAIVVLVLAGYATALALPEIVARSAAEAAW